MNSVIHNGIPWYDQNHQPVNAHAGCLIKVHNKFYLFGEYKTDGINHFIGFSKYSSVDLENWTYEGLALPMQKAGILGPNRVGERVKVLQVPNSSKLVMLMHSDDMSYNDPYVGIAVSNGINQPFQLLGPLLFNGQPIRKWDIGTFVDEDKTAYLLTHEGNIYRLSSDFRSVVEEVAMNVAVGGESPAMFHQGKYYYLLMSHKTSWERNDNYYLRAIDIHGPWTNQGNFCPEGTLTYNSQCSFIYTLTSNGLSVPMYMGDRWSFPKQASSATQVWLPITVKDDQISIPHFWENWNWQTTKKVTYNAEKLSLRFRSNQPGDKMTIDFSGTQLILEGKTDLNSGYAQLTLSDDHDNIIQDTTIDFYSLVPASGQRYMSPQLKEETYHLTIKVLGENGIWFDKSKHQFGSHDFYVTLTNYQVLKRRQDNDSFIN